MSQQPSQEELRVVMLGSIESGKTSVINTLLGHTGSDLGKRTVNCVRKEGEVRGRKLILVDTPGWWRNFSLIDTAEFKKRKLTLSVCKCPPGPHAFILTVKIDNPFTENNRRAIEEHLSLFGESIWERTIVVFTIIRDVLGAETMEALVDESLEQYIESGGETLRWLVRKCGNRYCVLKHDSKQISQLLEKIEGVVAKNHGGYFQLDEKVLKEIEEKKKANGEKARSRRLIVARQREGSKPEIQILLLGWVCSRKTMARNIILNLKENIGWRRTIQTNRKSGIVAGRLVSVVDTPGWWKYFSGQFTQEWMKTELRRSVTLDGKNPHAILLAVPADTTFLEEQRKITEDNMKIFGEHVWRHTMVLFTCGDLLGDTSIEEHIEYEGAPLQWLVEKCGNRYHVLGKDQGGESSQVTELLEKVEEMVATNSMFSLHEESQTPEVEEMAEEPDETNAEVVRFLDQEWNRMDKQMEETVKSICSQTLVLEGNRSIDDFPDHNEPFTDTSGNERLSTKCISPLTINPPVADGEGPADLSEQAEGETLERVREMLEREWSRQEVVVRERLHEILSEQHTPAGLSSESDESDQS
ncbi:GTPase IMAP family member 8-like isoform X1 [Alosa sapidissima]|uniref:GTPase IMAP family member 8-like isoform X1 n=1 Tax=Alosa sapidissima TaxID=34773 RepID=UPI001C08C3D9|nr:GTPase IMAP family member 8-like isoform X1 [Alosa sapidissima]